MDPSAELPPLKWSLYPGSHISLMPNLDSASTGSWRHDLIVIKFSAVCFEWVLSSDYGNLNDPKRGNAFPAHHPSVLSSFRYLSVFETWPHSDSNDWIVIWLTTSESVRASLDLAEQLAEWWTSWLHTLTWTTGLPVSSSFLKILLLMNNFWENVYFTKTTKRQLSFIVFKDWLLHVWTIDP